MRNNRQCSGVTLLEMIVVLVIVSIAAGLAVPNFQRSVEKRRADNAIATLRKISHCIRIYKQERGGTLPAGTQFSALEMTSAGNGCLDPSKFESTYTFPLATATIDASGGVIAQDTMTPRMVCVKPAGTSGRSGIVYDFPSSAEGCLATRTDMYRSFQE